MTQQQRYDAFRKTFSEEDGFRTKYQGRYFYVGPAVVCEKSLLGAVIKESPVPVQWDSMGMDLIVYPK